MADDQDDDGVAIPKAATVTADEIVEYERDVRRLIRFRSPFDRHLRFLDDMLREKERQAKKPGDE